MCDIQGRGGPCNEKRVWCAAFLVCHGRLVVIESIETTVEGKGLGKVSKRCVIPVMLSPFLFLSFSFHTSFQR
jgi:hypothetical protein